MKGMDQYQYTGSHIMPRKYYRIVSAQDAVRRARIVAGFTSAELAEAIGISRPMLSSIENGAGTSVKTAHKIAGAVGRSFEELFEVRDAR
jgi:transcriptional regulator with XRE-family HTH domain